MIVSDLNKFIYYDMPKTASCSLDVVFERYCSIPRPKIKHQRIIPEGKEHYIRIGTLRNPYERMVSLYNQGLRKNFEIAILGFDVFLDYCIKGLKYPDDETSVIANHFPMHKYYSILEPINFFIRFESIQDDLQKLPFIRSKVSLPRRNTRPHKTFEYFRSQDRIEKINLWAGEDFKKYGYTKYSI